MGSANLDNVTSVRYCDGAKAPWNSNSNRYADLKVQLYQSAI